MDRQELPPPFATHFHFSPLPYWFSFLNAILEATCQAATSPGGEVEKPLVSFPAGNIWSENEGEVFVCSTGASEVGLRVRMALTAARERLFLLPTAGSC